MKKIRYFIFILLITLVGCSNTTTTTQKRYGIPENEPFRLSSIVDVTSSRGVASYAVVAPYSDTYKINCTKSSKIVVYSQEKVIAEGTTELEANLEKDKIYGVRIETNEPSIKFMLHTTAVNNEVTLPYDIETQLDSSSYDVNGDENDPLQSTVINYTKREGGKYIYSNNPEMFKDDSVGKPFIRNFDLKGDIFFTFEHANYSSGEVYLGYQIKNDSNEDSYVTITNVGFQAGGTWFGQEAWYEYYNTQFQLPEEYLNNMSKYSNYDYAYSNMAPRIFAPTTYRIPAGEYFWIMGGTSQDAYLNINVDNSANRPLKVHNCANGNIKFNVTGGSVTGTFYVYNDIIQVLTPQQEQGYRAGNYSAQYSGIAEHAGVIDCDLEWLFNDETPECDLPVTYTNYYDENVPFKTTPYKEYNSTAHLHEDVESWITHLNPQNEHKAVGMDIVDFYWNDDFGNPIVIDNYHADGGGNTSNTANWMIEYQENYVFVNQGNSPRNIKINYKDGGTIAVIVRDTLTGKVLSTGYSMGQAKLYYSLDLVVPAHSVKQVTIQYVLVACSYGNVTHWVTLE